MMRSVIWSDYAGQDLDNLLDYYFSANGLDTAGKVDEAIAGKINYIASAAWMDTRVPQMPEEYRYVVETKYKYRIYYQIVGPSTVKILRLWNARREPLSAKTIKTAAKK